MSYLRMATHPAIFEKPLTHEEAVCNIEALLNLPHCRVIGEEEAFWNTYRKVTADVPTRGNLVRDAHLASIFAGHGVTTICTHDRDFRKFSFLDVRDPLAQQAARGRAQCGWRDAAGPTGAEKRFAEAARIHEKGSGGR